MTKYQALLERIHRTQDLDNAVWVMQWDRDTNMPAGGLSARIDQVTTLRRLHHEMLTSEETAALIDAAATEVQAT